ncbi:MAG: class I SAM-dependent methyltransferase [Candidatus Magasanikbacteria bacterium]|nr:class I SAM-dependent methyltransferase [Candidatus Magasanikbacteria bacterium]
MNYSILETPPSADYELLDSGDGEKLERYGNVVIARPDPQTLWRKQLSEKEWQKANAYFTRSSTDAAWSTRGEVPEKWAIEFGGLKFWIKLSAFKHTGLFPEQLSNWQWTEGLIRGAKRPVSVLNLFGYTGGASLAAAKAGSEVCHVDGSKAAIGWARNNAELSGLGDKPIRWILDDAAKFVQREIKRGHKYDGIIMDPPAFGHGPNKELWKIEDSFLPFIEMCKKTLSDNPLFFLVNGYAAGYSALAYKNSLQPIVSAYGGKMEIGELAIAESKSDRLLPCGIFARWSSI